MTTTFETLGKMADENMDIRLAPLTNIISIDIRGAKGEVTIGVDSGTAHELMSDKEFVGGFIVADKKQFDTLQGAVGRESAEGYAYLSKEDILTIETNVDCDVDLRGFHHYKKLPLVLKAHKMSKAFAVETLNGTVRGEAGEWLVIGTKGELYPVADDIFQELYIPAPQPSTKDIR